MQKTLCLMCVAMVWAALWSVSPCQAKDARATKSSGQSGVRRSHRPAPASKPSATELLVYSWWPELGPLPKTLGVGETSLQQTASLTRRGHLDVAAKRLQGLQQRAKATRNIRLQLLCLYFATQVRRQRLQLLGGGQRLNGQLNVAQGQGSKDDLASAFETQQLIRLLPGRDRADFWVAFRYGATVLGQHPDIVAQVRYKKTYDETVSARPSPGTDSSFDPFAEDSQKHLDLCRSVEEDAGAQKVLGFAVRRILSTITRGDVAAASHDFESARRAYEDGLQAARQARLPRSEAKFLMRLGDLLASPFGDARIMGYNLTSESGIRTMLTGGRTPRGVLPPTGVVLEEAAQRYGDAGAILGRLPLTGERCELTLRLAGVARFRNQHQNALSLLQRATEQAQKLNDVRLASIAQATTGLLNNSRDPFQSAVREATQAGDRAGAISLTEMAHAFAARLLFVQRDAYGAISRLRMASNALLDQKLGAEAPDHFYTLSSAYQALGRLDTAIEAAQAGVREQDLFLSELRRQDLLDKLAREQADARSGSLIPDRSRRPLEGALWVESDHQVFVLWRLLQLVQGQIQQEGDRVWIDRRGELKRSLLRAFKGASIVRGTDRYKSYIEPLRRWEKQGELLAKMQTQHSPRGWLRAFDEARPQLAEVMSPFEMLPLDVLASQRDPLRRPQVTAALQGLRPVEELAKAIASQVETPNDAAHQKVAMVYKQITSVFSLAYQAEAGDLLVAWAEQMQALVGRVPGWRNQKADLDLFRALGWLSRQKPGDAEQAEALLKALATHTTFEFGEPHFKVLVLSSLIEAHSQLGEDKRNAEVALWAYERLRFENEQVQKQRTNMDFAAKSSAEAAMLERKAALEGGLSPGQSLRLRVLQEQEEPRENPRSPTRSDVRRTLRSLPPHTTLLAFHFGSRAITIWRAEADSPLKLVRVPVSMPQVDRLRIELQTNVSQNLPGWKAPASKLYQWLIAPVGALPQNNTLVILRPGEMEGVPFELLAASPDADLLLLQHPVVYASALNREPLPTRAGATAPIPSAPPRPQAHLVVGLGSQGSPLSQTGTEAEAVAALFGTTPLIGPDATSERVLQRMKTAKWVHFATHATIDHSNPYASSLSLHDGKVEAWRLLLEAPRAEMIVLSACETSRAGASKGSVAGFAATSPTLSFFAAGNGARWMVATLWKAGDNSTAAIIQSFYHAYRSGTGDSPALALQKAKCQALKTAPHPFYFAHLVLSVRDVPSLQGAARP